MSNLFLNNGNRILLICVNVAFMGIVNKMCEFLIRSQMVCQLPVGLGVSIWETGMSEGWREGMRPLTGDCISQ